MKETKKHRQLVEQIKTQKKGECTVFDRDKKRYVNIRDYPPYRDPFEYNMNGGICCVFIGGLVGSFFGPTGVLVCGFGLGIFHYWITYGRFQ